MKVILRNSANNVYWLNGLSKATQGIALIQVLLITAVLSVFALYLSHTARQQVQQAIWAKDKVTALINLQNAEAKLFYQLMTTNKGLSDALYDTNEQLPNLNFYNEPFQFSNGVQIKIQDQSGLVQLHFPNIERLKQLIGVIEKDASNVDVLVARLLDWQDIDREQRINGAEVNLQDASKGLRNGAIPLVGEISEIAGFSNELINLLQKNTTIYKVGAFNPYHATEILLSLLTNEHVAEQVSIARKNRVLKIDEFKNLTGLSESDNAYFYTSNYMAIELTSKYGESFATKNIMAIVQPYSEGKTPPLNIYYSRGK